MMPFYRSLSIRTQSVLLIAAVGFSPLQHLASPRSTTPESISSFALETRRGSRRTSSRW